MAIPSSLPIVAQIVQGAPPRDFRGKGVVESQIDKNTYVIRLNASRVTVSVDSGELAVNAPVLLARQGDRVSILSLAQETPLPPVAVSRPGYDVNLTGKTPDVTGDAGRRALLDMLKQAAQVQENGDAAAVSRAVDLAARTIRDNRASMPQETQSELDKVLKLIITSRTSSAPDVRSQSAGQLSDAVRIVERMLSETSTTGSSPVRLQAGVREGLYYFADAQDAEEWTQLLTDKNSPASPQPKNLDLNQPVIVRVSQSAGGPAQAVMLQGEKAQAEVVHLFQSEMKSPLWKMISPQGVMDILAAKGFVPQDRIEQLDRALTSSISPSSAQALATTPARTDDLLRQWLAVALDTNVDARVLADRVPLTQASDLPSVVKQAGAAVENQPAPAPAPALTLAPALAPIAETSDGGAPPPAPAQPPAVSATSADVMIDSSRLSTVESKSNAIVNLW